MKKNIIIVASLLISNSYSMDTYKPLKEQQERSYIEQLPNEVKMLIIERVVSSHDLTQALKDINALVRTSTLFAEFLHNYKLKVKLAEALIVLPGKFSKKRLLGTFLGIKNEQWFIDQLKKEFNYELIHVTKDFKSLSIMPHICQGIANALIEMQTHYNKSNDVNNAAAYKVFSEAIEQGNREIVKLLIDAGINVNTIENNKFTFLFIAIMYNKANIVKMLLDSGADANQLGHRDVTPLHEASQNGYYSIVKLLVNAGANVLSLDTHRRNALDIAKHAYEDSITNKDNYLKTIALLEERIKLENEKIEMQKGAFTPKF